ISIFLYTSFSCTKIGLPLEDNIITPISVIGNINNMVLDTLNPIKICVSSSIRARGINYEWSYTSTDGGFFYTDSLMQKKILPNTYSPIKRGDTLQLYYIPKQLSINGVKNSFSFFIKNIFNPSKILLNKINLNVSEVSSEKPIIIGPQDSTLQDNNDNTDDYVDPNDPDIDWEIYGKRDTVGVGDHVYILGRNFKKFVTNTNTDIKINGRSIGKDSFTVITDTSVRIIVPPNLYAYFVDTMKIGLSMSIDLTLEGKGIIAEDFNGSKFSPVWRPTYFVMPLNKTIKKPNDIIIDTNTDLMYVSSVNKESYNTIHINTNNITTYDYNTTIDFPYSIALDENSIYISNYKPTNAEIFKVKKSTNDDTAKWYLFGLQNPFDILISNDKNSLFVYNENPSLVYQTTINIPLTNVNTLTPLYTLNEGLNLPAGIAINKKNEFFIAFESNSTIIKIMPNGTQSIIAGKPNIADYAGNNIDASLAILNNPHKILSDNYNSLFCTDKNNKAVRVISGFSNRIYTIAGNPLNPGSLSDITTADNIKATSVLFDNATSITIDQKNNIYIINENIYKLELR
ncbi:MAG: hypothetical protein ACRCR9_00385, partial [Chitinophagaceae bacterium]